MLCYTGAMGRVSAIPRAIRRAPPLALAQAVSPPHLADRCDELALEAACALNHATRELIAASNDPARDAFRLLDPLSRMVALQKTRGGQADCAAVAMGLRRGDPDAALEACRRLIDREAAPARKER